MPDQPPGRWRRRAWTLLGLTLVLLASGLVLGLTGGEGWTAVLGAIPVEAAFAVVGALVAARTGNRLGWLFLAAATVGALTVATNAYAARAATAELPAAAWVGWIFTVTLGIVAPLFFLTPLLFPDGRLPSPRWRPVAAIAVISGLIQLLCPALSDVNFSSNFPRLRDPVVAVAPLGTPLQRGRGGRARWCFCPPRPPSSSVSGEPGDEERLQLKWFTYAAAVSAVVILAVTQLSNDPLPAFEIVFLLIPAAVGTAILKYRLYYIDRLISRTLGYAIVTGLLVGLYAGLVLLATQVLSIKSPVAVAASTLAAAALFTPLRLRVQHVVDRRFNRVRYDADQTVAAFAARLQEGAALDAVRSDLLAVVNTAVEPAHLSVWTAPAAKRT